MARLDARWDNFWERGQTWYGFGQDGPSQTRYESAFTADASLKGVRTFAVLADANVQKTASGTWTIDSTLQSTRTGSFTADATRQSIAAGFSSADAVIGKNQTGSFVSSAVLLATQTSSTAAEAVVLTGRTGSFEAYAHVGGWFTAQANIVGGYTRVEGSFTADAVQMRVGPTYAASSYVNNASSQGSANDAYVAKPSGIAAGDTLVVAISFDALGNASTTISPPGVEWEQLSSLMLPDGNHGMAVFRKTATGSEPSGYTFTFSPSTTRNSAGALLLLRDANTYRVFSLLLTQSQSWHSLTYSGMAGLVTHFAASPNSANWYSITAGMTERVDIHASLASIGAYTAGISASPTTLTVEATQSTPTMLVGVVWSGSPYPQASAVFLRTTSGSWSADALIAARHVHADAVLTIRTRDLFYASAKIIYGYIGSFSADAIISVTRTTSASVVSVIDPFDRTETNSWGTGPLGTWGLYGPASAYSVDGVYGKTNNAINYYLAPSVGPLPEVVRSTSIWTVIIRFQWPTPMPAQGSSDFTYFAFDIYDEGWTSEIYTEISWNSPWASPGNTSELSLSFYDNDATWSYNAISVDDPNPADWYYLKVELDLEQDIAKGKVWADGDAEPNWMLSFSNVKTQNLATEGGLMLYYYNFYSGVGAGTWNTDYVQVSGLIQAAGIAIDAVVLRSMQHAITFDAWIQASSGTMVWGGGWTADAYLWQPLKTGSLTANALVTRSSVVSFLANALVIPATTTYYRSFTLDGFVIGTKASFPADAQISSPFTGQSFFVADAYLSNTHQGFIIAGAAVLERGVSDIFTADAFLSRGFFLANAYIAWWFTADAYVIPGFTANAWIILARQSGSTQANAVILQPLGASWIANAWIQSSGGTQTWGGEFTADAVIPEHVQYGVYANALIVDPYNEKWFIAMARIRVPPFTADAVIAQPSTHQFTSDGFIYATSMTLAWSFTADAIIARWVFTADALIFGSVPHSFTADAFIPGVWGAFTADAFIRTYFTADAYIRDTPALVFDENGNAVGRYEKRHTVNIIIRKGTVTTDITDHVVWQETEFTQQARTAPGTFTCTLNGKFTEWDGGEDIWVEIDGLRQFGGLVLQVQYSYWFSDKATPKTILMGADYNIYFDKLILWNRDNATVSGTYRPPATYAENTADRSLIRSVCTHLLDLPAGFDYSEYVDIVDSTLNPDERWMINTGQSFRAFMNEVSKITNAIWWIDPYLNLHYHSRSTVSAPYDITDGRGGVSCQNLTLLSDASGMVNDILVYGTLAYTTEGEIYLSRRQNTETIEKYGLRQYSEVRSDLHTENHVRKRATSIRDRKSIPLTTAALDLYEAGFVAGQVANVRLSAFDFEKQLVIRQVRLSFAVIQGRIGDKFYGDPKYHLELGLAQDDPWNIYDMLPWDMPPWELYIPWEWEPPAWTTPTDTFDRTVMTPGFETGIEPYATTAKHWLRNGTLLEQIWDDYAGPTAHDKYVRTQLPGLAFSYTGEAKTWFRSRIYDGDSFYTSSGNAGPTLPNWLQDLGPNYLPEGHNDLGHQVFFQVGPGEVWNNPIVPMDDLSLRPFLRQGRGVPRNAFWARLVRAHDWNGTAYDIAFELTSPYSPSVQPAYVKGEIRAGYLGRSAPEDAGWGTSVFELWMTQNNQYVYDDIDFYPPQGTADLYFILGTAGGPGDANWSDYWCNLDPRQSGAYAWSNRAPGDPPPQADFLFCTFHFGIYPIGDMWKHGMVPVANDWQDQIGYVEVTYPTPPGWGTSPDDKWHWMLGSYWGWDLTDLAYVDPTMGGVLEIVTPMTIDDLGDYNGSYISLYLQEDIGAFEFWGYFYGAQGRGDADWGPVMSVSVGEEHLYFIPGLNMYSDYQWGNYRSGVDLYQPFRVRVVTYGNTCATWIWQSGTQRPATPTYVETGGSVDGPWFEFEEYWDVDAGPAPMNCRFVMQGYKIWEVNETSPFTYNNEGDIIGGGVTDEVLSFGYTSPTTVDDPIWGWFGETVGVSPTGGFTSRYNVTRGFFSVWFEGERLTPEQDWVSLGGRSFALTPTYMATHSPAILKLNYLIDAGGIPTAWLHPQRRTRSDVRDDGEYPMGVRGLD